VHVGDTVLPLEDPGALKLDLFGIEVVEQSATLAEEHRDDMELEFSPAASLALVIAVSRSQR
jgi:hypothetical protein